MDRSTNCIKQVAHWPMETILLADSTSRMGTTFTDKTKLQPFSRCPDTKSEHAFPKLLAGMDANQFQQHSSCFAFACCLLCPVSFVHQELLICSLFGVTLAFASKAANHHV